MTIEIIDEPFTGGRPIRGLSGADAAALLALFNRNCRDDKPPRCLQYGYLPIFKRPDWTLALIPQQASEAGAIFMDSEIDDVDKGLLAFYGVSLDFARAHWPPVSPVEPFWRMLRDDGVEEVAIMPWNRQAKEVFLGAPHDDAVAYIEDMLPPRRAANLECAVFDTSGHWALYTCIEDISVLAGEPAIMDAYAERAGGWGWVKAMFAIKHQIGMRLRHEFAELYEYAGWVWPFDEGGRPAPPPAADP